MFTPGLFLVLVLCSFKKDTKDSSCDTFRSTLTGPILATRPANSSPSIIYEEDFEGRSAFDHYAKRQFATAYAFSQINKPVFDGKKAGRFELRESDTLNNDGTRAEVSFPVQTGNHRWYSFTNYFPAATYQYDNSDEVITQWHQGGGYSPSISLRTKQDNFILYFKPTPTTTEKITLSKVPKDRWVNFVFHINHSSGNDGFLEIYLDGKKLYSHTGAVMYKIEGLAKPPKWKIGIYKSDWNRDKTTDTRIRIFFMDNVRIGNEYANLSDMMAVSSAGHPARQE